MSLRKRFEIIPTAHSDNNREAFSEALLQILSILGNFLYRKYFDLFREDRSYMSSVEVFGYL